jgi:rRNA biogenesis protein RRP5
MFGAGPATWLRLVRFHLAAGDADAARRSLERALQALDAREHVAAISGAALLEFKVGDAERGRSLFEGVLRSYPRRLDLWSVYLDQEVARGEPARARALFERATHLALPPKKMKFLFKRYLEYERKHGDAAGVERVKKAAMEFVERAMGGGA